MLVFSSFQLCVRHFTGHIYVVSVNYSCQLKYSAVISLRLDSNGTFFVMSKVQATLLKV